MPNVNIFVSFEFGKDNDLKNAFYKQAEDESQHSIRNYSLNESYTESVWKGKARRAIRKCDIVFVLVGPDTHNAPGVLVETDMARGLKKPTVQVLSKRARRHEHGGVPHIEDRIPWKWKTIDKKIGELTSRRFAPPRP